MKKRNLIILIIIIIVIICCLLFLKLGMNNGKSDNLNELDENGLSVGAEFVIELEDTQATDGF